jgi:hypothetical protein
MPMKCPICGSQWDTEQGMLTHFALAHPGEKYKPQK